MAAGPVGDGISVDLDERGQVFAAVTEHDHLGHIGAGAQDILDERRRDRLAAGGHDEVARTVDEPERALVPFANVAGAQPAVLALDGSGSFRIVPVAIEQIGTPHHHFAVAGELDLPASGHGADVAGTRKRPALAGDDAARGFGLAVHLYQVDAEHLPQRHGLGRQRGAGADHELQPVEAELVEDGHEHARTAGTVERLARKARLAVPAPPRVSARKPQGEIGGGALAVAGIENAEQHLRGEFLQVARHGEQHRGCGLEQRRRQVFRAFAEMRDETRDQRQRHRDIAAEHVAERQVGHRAVRLLRQRRIMLDQVRGGGEMLAVRDQRALGMTGGARCIDDEGGVSRVETPRLLLQPGKVGLRDRGEQRIVTSKLGMRVGEHRGIVEHDDPLQSVQTVGKRQGLVDVFLVLRDEHHRAAVAQLILCLRGRCGRIDAVDDGAQRLRREVADQPLLAGIAHDGDAFAAGKAHRGKGARRPRHQRGIGAPVALAIEAEMLAAEGDGVRRRARALAQQQRCGLAAQRLPVDRWRCGHAALVERFPLRFYSSAAAVIL